MNDPWTQRENVLSAFEAAWRSSSSTPPQVEAFVGSDGDRVELLIELCVVDLEHRARRGLAGAVEDYLKRFPELQTASATRELVTGEIEVRSHVGRPVTRDEIRDRFPQLSAELAAVFSAADESADLAACGNAGGPRAMVSQFVSGQSIGHYRLNEAIGAGASSLVYSASDTRTGESVAVKFLHSHAAHDDVLRQRILREAAAAIEHKNVVKVLEVGTHNGIDFIVSQLIDGPTLEQRLQEQTFDSNAAASIVHDLALAVDAAHQQGTVHRDIKPANILMDGDTPLITDFGLAHLSEATQNLTHEGDVVGTPAYMAPEQAAGHGWLGDPRADTYSLGVVLYRMLVGTLPFSGTTAEVLNQVLHREAPSPRTANQSVPKELETIVLTCLEKDQADRYFTAKALAADLERYLNGRPIHASRPGPVSRLFRMSKRRPALAGAVLAMLFLMAFLIGSLLQLGRVGDERDRAVNAESQAVQSEREKQTLLASAAADAGILAMQRGRLTEAVSHFDQSLAQGVEDDLPLRLRRLDALLALRRVDQAREELTRIVQHADRQRFKGQIALWRAELQLETTGAVEDATALFSEALPHLADADADYCRGMLAENSLVALEQFQQAVASDPFHRRATRMLVTTLLSLARTEETLAEIETRRNLFPEDAALPLVESLALARQGESSRAHGIAERCAASDEEREIWLEFCEAVGSLELDMGEDESTVDLKSLSRFASRVVTDFKPLMLRRGLRVSPRLAEAFDGLPELLAKRPVLRLPNSVTQFLSTPEPDIEAIRASLELIAKAHPEMSTMTLLGYIHLMHRELDACRDCLEEALKHRSWIRNTEQGARFNLCTVTIIRGVIGRHDLERNHRVLIVATEGLDTDYVQKSDSFKAIVIGMMNAGEYFKAERFVDAWKDCEDCKVPEYLWYKALIEEHRSNWLAVVSLMDQLLAREDYDKVLGRPHRPNAINMRAHARTRIAQIVSRQESSEAADKSP